MSGILDAEKISAQLMQNAAGYADFMADPSGTHEWDGGHVASYEAAKLVEDLTAEVVRLKDVIAEAQDVAESWSPDYIDGRYADHMLTILAQATQTDKEK